MLQDNNHRKDAQWQVDLRFDVQVHIFMPPKPRAAIAVLIKKGRSGGGPAQDPRLIDLLRWIPASVKTKLSSTPSVWVGVLVPRA